MYRPAPRPLMLVSPPGVAASYRSTCLRLRRSARSLDFYKRVTQLHRERTEQSRAACAVTALARLLQRGGGANAGRLDIRVA
jgi:hypothetical protein